MFGNWAKCDLLLIGYKLLFFRKSGQTKKPVHDSYFQEKIFVLRNESRIYVNSLVIGNFGKIYIVP